MKLRVWWIPQVPMKAFRVEVESVQQAALIMNVLADYDIFQFENNVKPDYCNVGGLEVFEDGDWTDWYDEDTGIGDPREYMRHMRAIQEEATP